MELAKLEEDELAGWLELAPCDVEVAKLVKAESDIYVLRVAELAELEEGGGVLWLEA